MSQHVQDSVVVERRLRPIYDSFEVGNNKKALHEAEKVLKKTPNLRCAKALKGLALLRLGKTDESNVIIDKIVAEKPVDDSTLQVLSFIYKEIEEFEKICEIYQNAVEQDGGNEDSLTHLFMSYARVGDFVSQQRIAMQLYKLKPKNPYYCWAVMSCVLKALHGPDRNDAAKTKLSLDLAQRMMEKFINEDKLNAEQEVQMYFIILEQQRKFKEQLDFLDGEIGRRLYPGAPVELHIKLFKSLNKWSELNTMLKKLLREHLDRWDFYKEYIETVIRLVEVKTSNDLSAVDNDDDKSTGDQIDDSFELCHEFLCELIESSNKKYRGPYLGRLELHRMMTQNGFDAVELLGDFIEMLTDYFRIFGDKPCCAKDIALFLDHLEPEQRPGLATKLIQSSKISSSTLPKTTEQMQRHICSLQISRICGAHSLSVDHLTALYTAFTLHYEHGFNAFDFNILPTDIGISDAYALLAVQVMYDLALRLKSSERIVEALCLLNYLLSNSPSNFHAKLLCLQLYHHIGCSYGAQKMYESLNFKFIQLDSMGYLHSARLAVCGMPMLTKAVFEPTLKFFINSHKEGREYISMCYKYGSFSKLQEFMDFHERLTYSFQYTMTSVDALILELVCMSGTVEQNLNAFKFLQIDSDRDNIEWSKIRDNRDLSVIVRWDPKQQDTNQRNIASESYTQDLGCLRIRSNLLRLIACCVETLTKENYGKHGKNGLAVVDHEKCQLLEAQLNNWTEIFETLRATNHQPTSNEYLVNLLPSRLHSQLRMPYENIFRNIAQLILSLEHRCTKPSEAIFKLLDNDLETASKTICRTIDHYNQCDDLLWDRRNVLETIATGVEIFSIVTFVVTLMHEKCLTTPSTHRPTKRNKKKSANGDGGSGNAGSAVYIPTEKERHRILTSLTNRMKMELSTIDAAIESWKMPYLPKNLTDTLASLSLNPNVETLVEGTVRKDHELSIEELRIVLKDKLRMMNSLSKSSGSI